MATTPEGRIKKMIDRELKKLPVWYFNPQMGAFGRSGVPDKIVCAAGTFVAIEAKADRTKKPTALQQQCMDKIEQAGGVCFVVYDEATLEEAIEFIGRACYGCWRK